MSLPSIVTAHERRRNPSVSAGLRGSRHPGTCVLSEWTKFRSLRSTVYTFVVGIAATIVFAIIPAVINAVRWSTMSLQDKLAFNPLSRP